MPIEIARGSQTPIANPPEAVLTENGVGPALEKAALALVGRQVTLVLADVRTQQKLTLSTEPEWRAFFAEYLPSKDAAAGFAEALGMCFEDFRDLMEDLQRSTDTGFTMDLSPGLELAQLLGLNEVPGDYGDGLLVAGANVAPAGLTGATLAAGPAPLTLGPEILTLGVDSRFNHWERTEQEVWADFAMFDGSTNIFQENTGPAPFLKLTDPQWQDDEAYEVLSKLNFPVHLLMNGTEPQDNNEMFRELYLSCPELEKLGLTLRVRQRFDNQPPYANKGMYVQIKYDRQVDPATKRSSVHKAEDRTYQGSVPQEEGIEIVLSGKNKSGQTLRALQIIYQLLTERGVIPQGGRIELQPESLVLQKRRRSHLVADSLHEVQARRDALKAEVDKLTAASQPVDPKLTRFLELTERQLAQVQEASTLLSKYGKNWQPEGEAIIISADRYSLYDPAARAEMPIDIKDAVGRIGRGLHTETDFDYSFILEYDGAIKAIDQRLAGNPSNADELRADREKLVASLEKWHNDQSAVSDIISARLLAAGLTLEPEAKPKEQRAREAKAESDSPVYWS